MPSNHCLSEAARRRGLIVILVDTFFMWAGFFMVIPLISVHYVDDLGWSAASIGLVLAVRQLTQQGLTLPGGMLADRFGVEVADLRRHAAACGRLRLHGLGGHLPTAAGQRDAGGDRRRRCSSRRASAAIAALTDRDQPRSATTRWWASSAGWG